jgi:hypothetical protein
MFLELCFWTYKEPGHFARGTSRQTEPDAPS